MSDHHFLFTYSVSPNKNTDAAEKGADKVRREIAELNVYNWRKLSTVETTFVGIFELNGVSITKKREEAQTIVSEQISEILHEAKVYMDVVVYVALMVDNLGETLEFSI